MEHFHNGFFVKPLENLSLTSQNIPSLSAEVMVLGQEHFVVWGTDSNSETE